MSPRRWRKPLPPPLLAEGQTEAFDLALNEQNTLPGFNLTCRECFSRRIVGPIVRTVDPRWVIATCLDCAERGVVTVTPIQKGTPDEPSTQS